MAGCLRNRDESTKETKKMFGGVCPSVTKEREREKKKKEYREGEETVLWFRE